MLPTTTELLKAAPRVADLIGMDRNILKTLLKSPVFLFDGNELDKAPIGERISEMSKMGLPVSLPRPICIFEVQGEGGKNGAAVLTQQDDETIMGLLFRRYGPGRWSSVLVAGEMRNCKTPENLEFEARECAHKGIEAEVSTRILKAIILRCWAALWQDREDRNGDPERFCRHKPKRGPGSHGSQQKEPTIEYRIVPISPRLADSFRKQETGRTHASPKQHERRGHWRKYPSGKTGWVNACTVGDPCKGMIVKDYEVKNAHSADTKKAAS